MLITQQNATKKIFFKEFKKYLLKQRCNHKDKKDKKVEIKLLLTGQLIRLNVCWARQNLKHIYLI